MRVCNQIEPLKIASDSFHPFGTQFLGKYDEKTASEGGILYVTPDNTWWADVIVAGPDCTFGIGDKVLMNEYRGENVNFADGEFTILDEKNALAIEDA